ncbi:MAG: alpha/beta hydrolase family protein [Rhodospirillales bacterium]|jgi:pimeloyl-ACP methyl ester carboxylesterase
MRRIIGTLAIAAALAAAAGDALAQGEPRYVQFQPSATKGALYVPDRGQAPRTAFLVVHRTSNFLSHIATKELAQRGFMVLAMNPRSDNNEAIVNFEEIGLDIRQGVEFLRRQPGIGKVVLIGHSGGGPSTSFYQAVAEKGVGYCNGPEKLTPCPDSLAGLPKADGIVFLDAHPGNTVNALRGLNAAMRDESRPNDLDPALDPFSPANGFNPNGDSTYSADFVDRYSRAQSARMNRLIEKAQAMRAAIRAGTHTTTDDDVFVAYRDRARLSDVSTGVHAATTRPQKVLRDDGTVVTEIARTVRVSTPDNAKRDATLGVGALFLTVESFLSANAIRSTHSLDGIDWCSSNNSAPCAVQTITVPTLVMAMGGHYFITDGELIHDRSVAADKDFVVVEGATHGMTPCNACSRQTGKSYANATKNLFDYVARWAEARM